MPENQSVGKTPVAPLRLLLISTALLLIVFPWIPGATDFSANEISIRLVATISAPIVVMLLLLDATMLLVYLEGSHHEAQSRSWRASMWANLLASLFLVLSWVPFFVRLNS